MANVEFINKGNSKIIECNPNEKMKDICERFLISSELNKEAFEFKYNNNILNDELSFCQLSENKNSIKIKVNDKENSDEITIIYRRKNNKEVIKLFGYKFVKENRNFCRIIHEGKKYKLKEYFKNYSKDILIIKLKYINYIRSIKYMFHKCSTLLSVPDINKININKFNDLSFMFYNCQLLSSLPKDISQWDTSNIAHMYFMFYNCKSLTSLPDISKWNLNNIRSIDCMFCNCISLSFIPDIYKWNIKKTVYAGNIFEECFSMMNKPNGLIIK